MPGKIIIEINSDNYQVWYEHMHGALMAQINAAKCKNKKEVLEEVEKLLPELTKYEKEDSPYCDDCDD